MKYKIFDELDRLKKRFIFALVFISFLCYGQTSIETNNFPKPKNGKTYVIAHRGAHKDSAENTLSAYKKAIELGCDFIEIDVRKTKDGKFVSMHNSRIDEYIDEKSGRVNEFTLCELKNMKIYKDKNITDNFERIPTLEEILDLCKGKIGIYLDLKEPYIDEISAIIKKYKMEREVVWYIPFSYLNEIKKLKEVCEECIPMPDPEEKVKLNFLLNEIKPQVIATDMSQLDSEFVAVSHQYNSKVFVDENSGNEEEWKNIIDINCDGIQTDDPEKLINFLKKK